MKRYADVLLRQEGIAKSVNITGLDKPKIEDIVVKKWQTIIDLTAKIVDVPSGLIMQITENSMRVFLKSDNKGNPYEEDGSDSLGHGLYCETVIGNNAKLLVENALKYEEWKDNPDVKLNMISYYGLPITWPDKDFFGTICVLDNKENSYNENFKLLISEFKTGALPVSHELFEIRRKLSPFLSARFGVIFLFLFSIIRSNVPLYFAQRSFKILFALVGHHQAPDRLRRTFEINLFELSMPPLPIWKPPRFNAP